MMLLGLFADLYEIAPIYNMNFNVNDRHSVVTFNCMCVGSFGLFLIYT